MHKSVSLESKIIYSMSSFVVSARKYRPIRFDEVVGQGHVSQTLKNALQNNHLAHAFLFVVQEVLVKLLVPGY